MIERERTNQGRKWMRNKTGRIDVGLLSADEKTDPMDLKAYEEEGGYSGEHAAGTGTYSEGKRKCESNGR